MRFFLSGIVQGGGATFGPFVSRLEKKINTSILSEGYGDAIEVLGIVPIICTNHWWLMTGQKERRLYSPKNKSADYRLAINYDEFMGTDDEGKQRLIIENIIRAIRDLKRKIKKGFDGDKLEEDILALFNLKKEEVRE